MEVGKVRKNNLCKSVKSVDKSFYFKSRWNVFYRITHVWITNAKIELDKNKLGTGNASSLPYCALRNSFLDRIYPDL